MNQTLQITPETTADDLYQFTGSAGIARAVAESKATKIERLGSGESQPGNVNSRSTFYRVSGGQAGEGVRCCTTNGDPLWEEEDPEMFAAHADACGVTSGGPKGETMSALDKFTLAVFQPGDRRAIIDVMDPATGRTHVNRETLDEVRKRYPDAEVCPYEEWAAKRAAEQDTPVTWTEVSEERYQEMLEVLPPSNFSSGGFQVSEPVDHHAVSGAARYGAFVARGRKFYEASRPMTRAEFQEFQAKRLPVEGAAAPA